MSFVKHVKTFLTLIEESKSQQSPGIKVSALAFRFPLTLPHYIKNVIVSNWEWDVQKILLCSHCTVPTIIVTLTANTTRLPNEAPYNTFSLTCNATSSVEGRNVALPKRFLWRRRYGPSEFTLDLLTSNATIQIQDGDNLYQPTSFSMLTVTEDITQNYRYRCRVDLSLPTDTIYTRTDIYPINVTGKNCCYTCI